MRKVIIGVCVAYAAGVFLMEASTTYALWMVGVVACLACLLKLIVSTDVRSLFGIALAAVFVLGGLAIHIVGDETVKAPYAYVGRYVTLTGRVCEEPVTSGGADRYVLQANTIEYSGGMEELSDRISLTCFQSGQEPFRYGDVIRVHGFLQLPAEPLNEGDVDYAKSLRTKNIFFEMAADEPDADLIENHTSWFNPFDLANALRRYCTAAVDRHLSGNEDALAKGILLSDKSGLSAELESALQASGLSHIVAVSGLHVSVLLLLVTWLLSCFKLRKRYVYCASMAVLVLFALMQGCSPSILRAIIMAGTYMVADALGRDEDRLIALCIAAMALLLINPYALFDVSFQLSFAAMVGIILFAEPLFHWIGKWIPVRWLSSGIALTVAVQLFVAPVVAYYFGYVSPYVIVSNLLVGPAVQLALAGGLTIVLCSGFFGFVSQLAAGLMYVVTNYISGVAMLIFRLPGSSIPVPRPDLNFFLIYSLLILTVLLLVYRRPRLHVILASSACVGVVIGVLILSWMATDMLSVTFLNVGQGDAALLQTPGHKTMLIDGGGSAPWSESDVGERITVPYLMRRGIRRLDVALVSHYDKDHAQGVVAALRKLEVGLLVLPYRSENCDLEYKTLLEQAAVERGVPVYYYVEGAGLEFGGGVSATALSPSRVLAADETRSENDRSIVLKVTYGEMDVLFTGDIEAEIEHELVEKGADLEAEILKVAHHGSKTSTTLEFVEAVSPHYAIISVGENNAYGHPAASTLYHLAAVEAEVYRTDEDGDITVRLRRDGIADIHAFKRLERGGAL